MTVQCLYQRYLTVKLIARNIVIANKVIFQRGVHLVSNVFTDAIQRREEEVLCGRGGEALPQGLTLYTLIYHCDIKALPQEMLIQNTSVIHSVYVHIVPK